MEKEFAKQRTLLNNEYQELYDTIEDIKKEEASLNQQRQQIEGLFNLNHKKHSQILGE